MTHLPEVDSLPYHTVTVAGHHHSVQYRASTVICNYRPSTVKSKHSIPITAVFCYRTVQSLFQESSYRWNAPGGRASCKNQVFYDNNHKKRPLNSQQFIRFFSTF